MSIVAIRHAFAEAWSITRSGPWRTLLVVVLITVSLYLPGLLLLGCSNIERLARGARTSPAVVVTLNPGADARVLADQIAVWPEVRQVRIVPPAAAREKFLRTFPDLSPALGQLPDLEFPETLEVILPFAATPGASRAVARQAQRLAGVAAVDNDADFEMRFRAMVNLARNVALILGALLILAAILSVASAVRLALDQHRDEVEIMRLMGATETAVRVPFWLQGVMEGLVGGLLALCLLAISYEVVAIGLLHTVHPILSILWFEFLPWTACVAFPLAGAGAGFLGASLSVLRQRPNS